MTESFGSQVHAVTETTAFERVARVGYAVRAVLNVMLGVIVVRVATGDASEPAEQGSALEQVARAPFGRIALVIGVLGLLALGVERLTESVWGTKDLSGMERAYRGGRTAAKGAVYLALSVITALVAVRGRSDGAEKTVDVTAVLLRTTAGRFLVAGIGIGILGVAGYLLLKGATQRFRRDLDGGTEGDIGRVVVATAMAGYLSKGVAYGIVGALFVSAAVQVDASDAGGTSGAVSLLGRAPAGDWLTGIIGLGFVAYGLYSAVRARYARM